MALLHKYLLSAHVTDSKRTWLLCPAPIGRFQPFFLVWGEGRNSGPGLGEGLAEEGERLGFDEDGGRSPGCRGAGTRSPRSGQLVPTRPEALQSEWFLCGADGRAGRICHSFLPPATHPPASLLCLTAIEL